jgi:hypothetical protein
MRWSHEPPTMISGFDSDRTHSHTSDGSVTDLSTLAFLGPSICPHPIYEFDFPTMTTLMEEALKARLATRLSSSVVTPSISEA